MSYYIKRDEIFYAENTMLNVTAKWVQSLEQLKIALTSIANTTAIEGSAADAIRTYVQEEPICVVDALIVCIQTFQKKLQVCADGYKILDKNESAQINCERLSEICQTIDYNYQDFYRNREALVAELNSVNDIFDAGVPSNSVYNDYDSLKEMIDQCQEQIKDYEESHLHDMDAVEELLSKVSAALDATINRPVVQISNYKKGEIPSGEIMKGLQDARETAEKVTTGGAFLTSLSIAQNNYSERVKEELEKQRIRKGLVTVIGGVALVASALITVASFGSATPVLVVVSAGVAGGFGIAETVEGAQEFYYGATGDTESVAFNPLRDTVFASNPELYYCCKEVSEYGLVLSSIGGAGLTTLRLGGSVYQAVDKMGVEVGKEFITDSAGKMTREGLEAVTDNNKIYMATGENGVELALQAGL